jgi:hypothetical protein
MASANDVLIPEGDALAEAIALFKSHFGEAPTIAAAAPGRFVTALSQPLSFLCAKPARAAQGLCGAVTSKSQPHRTQAPRIQTHRASVVAMARTALIEHLWRALSCAPRLEGGGGWPLARHISSSGRGLGKMRAKCAQSTPCSSDRVVVQVVGCGWRVHAEAVRACSLATRSGQRRGNLSCPMTASSRCCVIELMSVSHRGLVQASVTLTPPTHLDIGLVYSH